MNTKYSEKFKDPRWQKKRLEILTRDDWSCSLCGDRESTLHVHHLYYDKGKDPWDYPESALISLCETCHLSEHDGIDCSIERLNDAIKRYSAMSHEIDRLAIAFENNKGDNVCHDGPTIIWALSIILLDKELHEQAIDLSLKSSKKKFE